MSGALFQSPPIEASEAAIFGIFNKELEQLEVRSI